MSDSIYSWSQTAASNSSADASINWAEFQDPDTVNDSARQMMARVAAYISDTAPKRTSTGTGNAYAVTSDAAGAALVNGMTICFIADRANTSSCTLNVDGLGAKPFRPKIGVEFNAGDILASQPVIAFYVSATQEWVAVNTGYHVSSTAAGIGLQAVIALLPKIGDIVISSDATPAAGRIRLTETTQALLKTSYSELNSWLSARSYPWGSTATHFNLPPAAGYFLRFAATSTAVDTAGARSAGATQSDQNKAHTHSVSATGSTSSDGAHTHTVPFAQGGTNYQNGAFSAPVIAGTTNTGSSGAHTHTVSVSGTAATDGGDEVRVKNVGFHADIIASSADSAAQIALFGFPYQWDTGTTSADPGAGRVRANNATLGSATELYISNLDRWGVVINGVTASLQVNERISLSKVGSQANRFIVTVTATPTILAAHTIVPISVNLANGTLASNDNMAVEFMGGGTAGGLPVGGTTKQFLRKNSATTGDVSWANDTDLLGVNSTSASSTYRLAVASPASLFEYTGSGGHELTISKAASGDAATTRYFSAGVDYAEAGLYGDNDYRIRVSNGGGFFNAMIVDRTSGAVSFPNSVLIPTGGTTKQFLRKNSATSGDASWANDTDLLGINSTAATSTYRLAVDSAASLFRYNVSGGHQMTIQKASSGDAATSLYFSSTLAHAEAGLYGSNDWTLRVSGDGSTFNNAIIADRNTGNVGLKSAAYTIRAPVQVGQSFSVCNLDGGTASTDLADFIYYSGGWKLTTGAAGVLMQFSSGAIKYWTAPAGSAGDAASLTNIFTVNANGTTTTAGAPLPSADNTHDIGSISLRWQDIYATNATIQTSDQTKKENITDIPHGLDLVNALRPVQFKWKDDTKPAVTRSVTKQRQKRIARQVTREVIDFVRTGEHFVRTVSEVTETIDDPQWIVGPVLAADGSAVIGPDGQQLVHRVPDMEDYTEEEVVEGAVDQTYSRLHFGLIAQEVKATLDARGIDTAAFAPFVQGENGLQGLRYGEFIPILLRAVQELSARVTALEAA